MIANSYGSETIEPSRGLGLRSNMMPPNLLFVNGRLRRWMTEPSLYRELNLGSLEPQELYRQQLAAEDHRLSRTV